MRAVRRRVSALLAVLANQLRFVVAARGCTHRIWSRSAFLEQVAGKDVVSRPLTDLAHLFAGLAER